MALQCISYSDRTSEADEQTLERVRRWVYPHDAVIIASVLAVGLAAPQEVDSILSQQDNSLALPQAPAQVVAAAAAESQIQQIVELHRHRLRHDHEEHLNNKWHHIPRPNIHHHNVHEVERLKHLAQEAFLRADKHKHEEGQGNRHHDHHSIEASRILDDHNKHNPYFIKEALRKSKVYRPHHEHKPHHELSPYQEHRYHEEHKPHYEHRSHEEHRPHHEHRPRHEHRHHEVRRLREHEGHRDRLPIDKHHDRRVHFHHEYLNFYEQPLSIFGGKAYAYLPYTDRPLLHYEELPHHRHHERHH